MAKLQIDGIEVADIDAARALQVLRMVRDNGPGHVVTVASRPPAKSGTGKQPPMEIVLPLAFASRSTPARRS